MPTHRQRAAQAASDTHSQFAQIPYLSGTEPEGFLYQGSQPLPLLPRGLGYQLRSAVMEGDPFDIAIDWQNYSFPAPPGATCAGEKAPPVYRDSIMNEKMTNRILVLNTANEKKPGGDWEGGFLGLGAEESLARRSNLVQTLNPHFYPLNDRGGIYSPCVIVFKGGHEQDYLNWETSRWTCVSVVSVAAVRRPKTDETGTRYSFAEERDLQKEKMKTILRIAALNGHVNLVLGGFGSCGPGTGSGDGNYPGSGNTTSPPRSTSIALSGTSSSYKNPIKDVCKLWKELLIDSEEFQGYFKNIVFAVGGGENGGQKEFRKYFG
ncbi:hypothetical protein BZA77DRAFT_317593 [Pyronema omphalodes]|nr:hypothetical protein BZA77DRAFT_317593 [Pyronema omphalodes]